MSDYLAGLATLMLIYAMICIAQNAAVGWTGQFNIAQGATFGVGAFAYAIALKAGYPMLGAFLLAAVSGAAVGAGLAYSLRNVTDHMFSMATLAFQMVLVAFALNVPFTGGFFGMPGVPPPSILGFVPGSYFEWLVILAPLCMLYWLSYTLLTATRIGIVFKAIREDEVATQALGRSVVGYKVLALTLASVGSSFGGALYAGYIGFIDPMQFWFEFSLLILSSLIVGGLANPLGPFVGLGVVMLLPEGLRLVPEIPSDVRARLLQVMYAILLLLFVLFRPQGLVPETPGQWSLGSRTWQRKRGTGRSTLMLHFRSSEHLRSSEHGATAGDSIPPLPLDRTTPEQG